MSDSGLVTTNEKHAAIIAAFVSALVRGNPTDDRFQMFETICYHASLAYGDTLPPGVLQGEMVDPDVYKPLLDNPVAGPLLAYFVNALLSYDAGDSVGQMNTTDRRAALSAALSLTGKQGKRQLPLAQQMTISVRYSTELIIAREARRAAGKAANTKSEGEAARRALYEWQYGEPYDSLHDTHKSRMAELRRILREFNSELE